MARLRPRRFRLVVVVALAHLLPVCVEGQAASGGVPSAHEVFAGGELEGYLRSLSVLDSTTAYPWAIRGLAPVEVRRIAPADASHPWAGRYDFRSGSGSGIQFAWVHPRAGVVYNSAFPYGGNDGPIWAGRGLTTSLQAGFSLSSGPVSLVVAPEAFWAQNADFEIASNGQPGRIAYGDEHYPGVIDLPQRFGDQPYARLDAGQSTLRADWEYLTVGVSTANQFWGPAVAHPVILGNNAAGFPHVFIGTGRPVHVGLGRLHGRLIWGRLDQSEYSGAREGNEHRLMTGLVMTFLPFGIDGLELGLTRFFHGSWPQDGFSRADLLRPFEGFLKTSLFDELEEDPERNAENQLASVLFRWAVPGSGFEIYGELGRDDHSWNLRQLALQPDDLASYLLGFRHTWRRSDGGLVAVSGEILDTDVSHLARPDAVRGQPPMYLHSGQRQGHTQRGQMLASGAGFGGGAALLSADYFHRQGRWTMKWERTERTLDTDHSGRPFNETGPDVVHALGIESLLFRSRHDLRLGLTGLYNLNRDGGDDVFGLRAVVGVQARW